MSSQRLGLVRARMRRLKTLPVAPTLLTAGNLASGLTAILCAAHNMLLPGAILIFVAMICDMFDGKVARMTRQDGPFGAQLDSLSDVVSFGVAPAILVHRLILGQSGVFEYGERILWFLTVFYPVMAAIRLARYNVEHAGPQPAGPHASTDFRGIPSPGAAAVIAAMIIFQQTNAELLGSPRQMLNYQNMMDSLDWFRWVLLFVSVTCALTMVSTVRYPHVGNSFFGRMSFPKVILILLVVGLFTTYPAAVLLAATLGYFSWGLLAAGVRALSSLRAGRSPLDDADDDAAEDAGLARHDDDLGVGPAPGR